MATQSGGGRGRLSAGPYPKWRAARALGHYLPALIRPAFEKYGFPAAAILTSWAEIAGSELASFTAPERLKWPRDGADAGRRRGATLILRVSGPRAIEIEHMKTQLLERINSAFGYQAVTGLRILQAPLPHPPNAARRNSTAAPRALPPDVSAIEDARLRASLGRIAQGMECRRAGGPAQGAPMA